MCLETNQVIKLTYYRISTLCVCQTSIKVPHGPKSIHGSILYSTPSRSWWPKAFHHAPPTTHATSTHTPPSPTAFDPTTPEGK